MVILFIVWVAVWAFAALTGLVSTLAEPIAKLLHTDQNTITVTILLLIPVLCYFVYS